MEKGLLMLVLTRRIGEKIIINDDIVLTVVRIQGDKVRVGIEAPRSIPVHREEVLERIQRWQAEQEKQTGTQPVSPAPPDDVPRSGLVRSARRTS
jgi:carbon storage regulator